MSKELTGPSYCWLTWPGAEVHIIPDPQKNVAICGKRFWMSDPFLLVNPPYGEICQKCAKKAGLDLPLSDEG